MTPTKYLKAALALVESESIRKWAVSRKNKPVWTAAARNAINRGADPQMFAAYIVSVAMG